MKVLITYYSQSGQTENIANVISDTMKEKFETDLLKLKQVNLKTINEYDLVFVGAPCHHSDLVKQVQKFLKKLPKGASFKLVGFYTHACMPPETSEEDKVLFERWVGKCQPTFEKIASEKEIDLLGTFRCQAKATPPIEKFIRKQIITDDKKWEEYLPDLRERPKKEDLDKARDFALKILQQVS